MIREEEAWRRQADLPVGREAGVMTNAAEMDAPEMRYFIDGIEVSAAVAVRAEARGAARVSQGGSGVVPETLRQPGETRDQWLRPWIAMRSTRGTPPEVSAS